MPTPVKTLSNDAVGVHTSCSVGEVTVGLLVHSKPVSSEFTAKN